MVTSEAAERFLAAPLLAEVDPASRRALLDVLTESRAPAGAMLIEQGRGDDRIHFLLEGSVKVLRTHAGRREEAVATLAAPSVFGETSFFRLRPPIVSVRADTPVWLLSLDHDAHDRLRREDLKAAEQLALAAARLLAERFDMLDRRISDYIAQHPDGPQRASEWARFRARLFEGSSI